MDNILFVIPARSGSQGIKDKNIIFWKGKRLIMHTFDFLIKKNINVKNICISTDSDNYIDILLKEGINKNCFIKRPKCIAEDIVVDYPLSFIHGQLKEIEDKKFDYIAIMRPTSPVRPDNIIEKGIELLNKNPSFSSVRAMRKVKEHPFRVWKMVDGNFVEPLMNNVFEPGNIPRQKLSKKYYYQSGELEIVKRSTLQLGSVSGSKVGVIEINEANVDIDSEDDLKY